MRPSSAGVVVLSWGQPAALLAVLGGVALLFLRYRQRFARWFDDRLRRHIDDDLDDAGR